MGLDMYLYKKHYIGNQYRKEEEKVKVILPETQEDVLFPVENIQEDRISDITEEVAYWRKSNQIHNWFVNNVQDGEDDCGNYYVSNENLTTLVNLCKSTLELLDKSEKDEDGTFIINEEDIELQTTAGFFFGNTEYNQYYYDDLKDTIEQLEPLLEDEVGDYEYSSSW